MRLKEDSSSWKASGIKRRDFRHAKDEPEIPRQGRSKKKHKNLKRWCRGKEGREHDYVEVAKYDGYLKLDKCRLCGKETNLRFLPFNRWQLVNKARSYSLGVVEILSQSIPDVALKDVRMIVFEAVREQYLEPTSTFEVILDNVGIANLRLKSISVSGYLSRKVRVADYSYNGHNEDFCRTVNKELSKLGVS